MCLSRGGSSQEQHSCPFLCLLPSSLSTTQKVRFANKIHKRGTNLGTRSVVREVKDHIIKTTLDNSIPSVNPGKYLHCVLFLTDFYIFWDKGNSLLLKKHNLPPPNTNQRTCPSNAVAAEATFIN